MSTLVTTALKHNASASNNMVLDSNGRVGIGTNIPAYPLVVSGNDGTDASFLGATGGIAYVGSVGAKPLVLETDATERMRIDASGRITTPAQPMFWGKHGAIATYGAGALIQITSVYDPNSMFSGASNYRVTVPVAGRYLVAADLLLNAGSAGPLSIHIRKNGSNQIRFYSSTGYNYQAAGATIILNCAANDYIDLISGEANCTLYGGDIGNFIVYLLG